MSTVLSLIVAFLLGSVPFGLLLTRFAGLGDIRAIGSGSIGATNVLRTGRRDLAAATLLLDALKGVAAVLLARQFGGLPAWDLPAWAGLAAVLGHCLTPWLGFHGGKGVATALGALLGIAWPVALGVFAVWAVVAALTRISSAAALAACLATPFIAVPFIGWNLSLALLAAWIVMRHHANIVRLRAGAEPRIGQR